MYLSQKRFNGFRRIFFFNLSFTMGLCFSKIHFLHWIHFQMYQFLLAFLANFLCAQWFILTYVGSWFILSVLIGSYRFSWRQAGFSKAVDDHYYVLLGFRKVFTFRESLSDLHSLVVKLMNIISEPSQNKAGHSSGSLKYNMRFSLQSNRKMKNTEAVESGFCLHVLK